jgi:hypothetical protein
MNINYRGYQVMLGKCLEVVRQLITVLENRMV